MTHSVLFITKAACSLTVMMKIELLKTKEERILGHNQKCLESMRFFCWKMSKFHIFK